ncbi:MAG: HlyD family type I secretion periplasmic adaptor subunit [Pseudomonadota bacterium]
MFGNRIEDEYINTITASSAAMRGRSQWPIIRWFFIGMLAFVIWASVYEIEQQTAGLGRVVPSSQVQVVQTLEGGIIQSINVAEGDVVDVGTVLMRIDDTGFSSQLGELQQRELALLAERARLEAEANNLLAIEFDRVLAERGKGAIAAEEEVFTSRREQLKTEVTVLEKRLEQRIAAIDELKANQDKLQNILKLQAREIELTSSLADRGFVSEVELLRLQSNYAELEGDLAIANASLPKLEASVAETRNEILSTRSAYSLTAKERLAVVQQELAVVAESIRSASDRVTRTQLKSPVRGIVNKINNTSVGAVVQPALDIIEIVPIDDGLLIEAEIRPQDVAFIRTNEAASVRLTAYDYLIYGQLEGTVERIGADTITDDQGEEFFKVMVRTDRNYLGTEDNPFPISPGMVANVTIQTGQQTVMTYLLKPILRARAEAFRER